MDNPSDEAIAEALRLVGDCTNTIDVIRRNAERGAAWARNVIAHARTIDQRNKLVEALEAEDAYWAASKALACALPRLRATAEHAMAAASTRRDAARQALTQIRSGQ